MYFRDIVWGTFRLPDIAKKIIGTPEFQRLRYINQLGLSPIYFNSINGSRYEHSIGTCYLANYVTDILKIQYPHFVTDEDRKLICVASLIHDIGHGPFSHVFDRYSKSDHETRSISILEKINTEHFIGLSQEDIGTITKMLNPGNYDTYWKYNILSNDKIDIDRLDYIQRDSLYLGFRTDVSRNKALTLLKHFKINDKGNLYINPGGIIIQNHLDVIRKELYSSYYKTQKVRESEDILLEILNILKPKDYPTEQFLKLTDQTIISLALENNLTNTKMKQILGMMNK